MSEYRPFGPFEIPRDEDLIDNSKEGLREFWELVNRSASGLSEARGCYIFATRPRGGGMRPWYVGQAKGAFKDEALASRNLTEYNKVVNNYKWGTPIMFLLAQMTPQKKGFSNKAKDADKDEISHVETFLIGLALEKNPDLINIQVATRLKNLNIPGLWGDTRKIYRTESEKDLRKLFGIK